MVTVYWQWWNSRAWIGTATALSKHSNLRHTKTHTKHNAQKDIVSRVVQLTGLMHDSHVYRERKGHLRKGMRKA